MRSTVTLFPSSIFISLNTSQLVMYTGLCALPPFIPLTSLSSLYSTLLWFFKEELKERDISRQSHLISLVKVYAFVFFCSFTLPLSPSDFYFISLSNPTTLFPGKCHAHFMTRWPHPPTVINVIARFISRWTTVSCQCISSSRSLRADTVVYMLYR